MLQEILDLEWQAAKSQPEEAAKPRPGRKPPRKPRKVEKPRVRAVHRLGPGHERADGVRALRRRRAGPDRAIPQAQRSSGAYLALVHGHPPAMTVQSHLVRDRGDGKRGSAKTPPKNDKSARHAVTHVEPLEPVRQRLPPGPLPPGDRPHTPDPHPPERERPPPSSATSSTGRKGDHIPPPSPARPPLGYPPDRTAPPLRFESPLPDDLARWIKRVDGT